MASSVRGLDTVLSMPGCGVDTVEQKKKDKWALRSCDPSAISARLLPVWQFDASPAMRITLLVYPRTRTPGMHVLLLS